MSHYNDVERLAYLHRRLLEINARLPETQQQAELHASKLMEVSNNQEFAQMEGTVRQMFSTADEIRQQIALAIGYLEGRMKS